jgi:hypothetical protein
MERWPKSKKKPCHILPQAQVRLGFIQKVGYHAVLAPLKSLLEYPDLMRIPQSPQPNPRVMISPKTGEE